MSGLESTSQGSELARKIEREGNTVMPLNNPQVQGYLAEIAYPDAAKPMNIWALGDEAAGIAPLSGPFRDYIDSLRTKEGYPTIDVADKAELQKLLIAVRAHSPETLH